MRGALRRGQSRNEKQSRAFTSASWTAAGSAAPRRFRPPANRPNLLESSARTESGVAAPALPPQSTTSPPVTKENSVCAYSGILWSWVFPFIPCPPQPRCQIGAPVFDPARSKTTANASDREIGAPSSAGPLLHVSWPQRLSPLASMPAIRRMITTSAGLRRPAKR